jgi:nitrate reductase beta subunit
MLTEADCTPEQADAIYEMTALSSFEERFSIPPSHREEAIEMLEDPLERKQQVGFGFRTGPKRGM